MAVDPAAAGESTVGLSSDTGVGPVRRIELQMDKLEACRKEAFAKNLGLVARIGFVRDCMK